MAACAQGHHDWKLPHPFTDHGNMCGSWSSASVPFLFCIVLTLVNQLARFCIQSFTGFSLHLGDFCSLNKIASSSFWGLLSMFYFFFSDVFWNLSWFSWDIFRWCYLLIALGAASTGAVKHWFSADYKPSKWLLWLLVWMCFALGTLGYKKMCCSSFKKK